MTRIAITGVGAVTPLGVGMDDTWKAMLAGRSGAGPLTRFDASDFPVRIACQADAFDPLEHMDPRTARRSDRNCQLALASAQMAVGDGLPYEPGCVGVVIGSGIGGLQTLEDQIGVLAERGPSKVSAFAVPLLMLNGASGAVAMRYGFTGPSYAVASACASGAHAIGEAARLIRTGAADAVVAGGTEAAVTPIAMSAFAAMGALSRRNDEPERASRPFDADRDGFVLGEGAAVLVLERLDAAQARGAEILAELAGYGASSDAFHLTQPDPDGAGAVAAMRAALQGIDPDEIGYVNAHGTSTPFNDRIEAAAIVSVFGEHRPAVSSTKSSTGHLLGAAGALEAAVCVRALRDGVLPPSINLENPDRDVDLDLVANAPREAQVDVALSNSFGFGGHNACLAFRRAS